MKLDNLVLSASILMSALMISGSIIYSTGSLDINALGTNNTQNAEVNNAEPTGNNNQPSPTPTNNEPTIKTVEMDDDPVLGQADAPVTIVEFSDYECPFCQRYFNNTYPELKENYIDSGQVKVVYRDLPLSFHDPAATKMAIAANCARDQGNDETYFQMHDLIFENTAANGEGMPDEDLYALANEVGINQSQFQTCIENEEFKQEVSDDESYASSVGATGTPTFFIGKSDSGGENSIKGEKLVGAQPFSRFKSVIDSYLK